MRCPHCEQEVRLVKAFAGQENREKSPQIPDKAEVGAVLAMIDDNNLANGWEMKFVSETRQRWHDHGMKIWFSEAQMAKLRGIAEERR